MSICPHAAFIRCCPRRSASKYGYNVHACIFDELLGQPNRKLFDVMTKGSGAARKQPLNFVITTAGSDKNSICYEVHSKAMDILEGRKHDSHLLPSGVFYAHGRGLDRPKGLEGRKPVAGQDGGH